MFGEHESESPRVSSPWDPFLPTPPSRGVSPQVNAALHNGIPKLVPEVEEGNVEYKLKLTHISNARFARLVTQLKWRLLEGGGQAYYELGVADSGALIGLSRADLEESLETLEMMAGEIGASVIVVKEIEVPPTIAALADKDSGYTDPDTGEWTRKMRRRAPAGGGPAFSDGGDGSTSATTTEAETDFSFADFADQDDVSTSCPTSYRGPDIAAFSATITSIAHRPVRTNPSRPTAQSSPFIAPIDDDLALFSMEPEPAFPDETDTPASGVIADDELDLAFGLEAGLGPRRASFAGLEIAAVYKPRPVRHRVRPGASAPLGPTPGRHGKRSNKNKERKAHPWQQRGIAASGQDGLSKEEKSLQRRLARDKKREEKRNALIALAQAETRDEGEPVTSGSHAPATVLAGSQDEDVGSKASALLVDVDEEANTLASGVDGLHAAVDSTGVAEDDSPETSPVLQARQLAEIVVATAEVGREPRLIVEALVVRKMSIEEATLDFGRLAIL
ncbi:hypothetical protein DICSQDRAFT_157623 [Dichomitus squalens LYAD-421 SS1]|uniref:GTP binding protein 2 n=1 Tax=Dichomitus squalens (strain LYAD-421) TaxID=732165 RepID=R7SLG8_DICSQ|nr:uncharacterized protein DICSQDRAFT_157623 [Dichomitus squalens LYAD-421 SS1]EJF57011.1 hypothetical protein DICSQDRAFT_157623 [Dichomitus squalens LYAD-421 SS1]